MLLKPLSLKDGTETKIEPCRKPLRMKAVKFEARPMKGGSDVSLVFGSWQGKCNLTIVPLDDFDLILGVDFILSAKVSVIPHLSEIFIGDKRNPTFVDGEFVNGTNMNNNEYRLLSTMQTKTGLRHGEMTYLSALV